MWLGLRSSHGLYREEIEMKFKWRSDYMPRFNTKNGEANRRTYEALTDFISGNGPQTRDALEAFAKSFGWHHQYSVGVPGGVEYVRWHIQHKNLVEA
jgi:hypothetical protein